MDPKIKRKWLKELRSGNWTQGREYLCSIDESGGASYCCLGVLTEIVRGEGVWQARGGWERAQPLRVARTSLDQMPPDSLLKEVGLLNSTINDDKAADELAHLNDTGKTFKQLANIIEKKL